MGLSLSGCSRSGDESDFFRAVQSGDYAAVEAVLAVEPEIASSVTFYDRLSSLHIAAANGRLEVLSMLLDRSQQPDVVSRLKQTPLMLAAIHGKADCLRKLIDAGAKILMFDSVHERSCLHHAAYYGHTDCLQAILSSAQTSLADSWGFSRFVNTRDDNGATPLHLAARQGHSECVHMLLDSGAIISSSTGSYGFPGSTPLHLAARRGSLNCIRELLAWGADRLQRDSGGQIPFEIALRRNHGACAALLNPASAEPLVWPSPLKFISELNPDTKALLEAALVEANRERERNILKGTKYCLPSPPHSNNETHDDEPEDGDTELCCICFDQACTIEVGDCGHQMCASCTLALCCHSKPNPATQCLPSPSCPFCRSTISCLVAAKIKPEDSDEQQPHSPRPSLTKARRSRNLSEGSSSFKGLSSAFGMLGRGSGRIVDSITVADKPEHA